MSDDHHFPDMSVRYLFWKFSFQVKKATGGKKIYKEGSVEKKRIAKLRESVPQKSLKKWSLVDSKHEGSLYLLCPEIRKILKQNSRRGGKLRKHLLSNGLWLTVEPRYSIWWRCLGLWRGTVNASERWRQLLTGASSTNKQTNKTEEEEKHKN